MFNKWLNFIVWYTNFLYKLKKKIEYTNIVLTILITLFIIFLELALAVISLPIYIFLKPDTLRKKISINAVKYNLILKNYSLRRKLTLSALFIAFLVIIIKAFTALIISIYISGTLRF